MKVNELDRLSNFSKRFSEYIIELQRPENSTLWETYGEQLIKYETQLGTCRVLRNIKRFCKRIPLEL